MRRARALIAVAAAAVLGGCATLTASECRRGDWEALGREDGARGVPAQELERHREACVKHGLAPDAARYRAGHEQGLAGYCTPRGGYLAGRRNEPYHDVCAGAKETAFLEARRRGREVFDLLRDVREARRRREEFELAAMQGDYGPEDRTQLRFRAEEAGARLRIREWDLERLDRRYAREFGAPELTWAEMREPP